MCGWIVRTNTNYLNLMVKFFYPEPKASVHDSCFLLMSWGADLSKQTPELNWFWKSIAGNFGLRRI